MKFWEESKKKFLENKNASTTYKKYDSIFYKIDEMLDLTTGKIFYNTSEKELRNKLEMLVEKISSVKEEKFLNLFNRMIDIIEKRIQKKWESRLIDILIKLREKKGYSQAKLARLAGVSNAYVWRYENGERQNLSLHKLKSITNALEVDMSLILSEAIDGNTNIIKQSNKLDSLIKKSIILKENNEFYSDEEKEKLINFIKEIDSIELQKEISFESVIKLVEVFNKYKKK